MPVYRVVVEVRTAGRLPSPRPDILGGAVRDLAATLARASAAIATDATVSAPTAQTEPASAAAAALPLADYRAGRIAIEWMDAPDAPAAPEDAHTHTHLHANRPGSYAAVASSTASTAAAAASDTVTVKTSPPAAQSAALRASPATAQSVALKPSTATTQSVALNPSAEAFRPSSSAAAAVSHTHKPAAAAKLAVVSTAQQQRAAAPPPTAVATAKPTLVAATALSVPQGDAVRFVCGNTEVTAGVLHLFRSREKGVGTETPPSDIVAVLAVPAYMSSADFLQFIAPHLPHISSIRVLRDVVATRSMVVMRFRDTASAQAFHHEYNRRPFSSMESETCQSVFVQSVELLSPSETAIFPMEERVAELPTCPVCLERLDTSVTGVFSLMCRHTFHCRCLAKWADNSCPVCRYGRKPVPDDAHSECTVCGAHDNLWMCLICGHVGCSRYGAGHAASHFRDSHHPFAMEVETQRVWDYVGDGYVHRLIASSADGKLVELPGTDDAPADAERRTHAPEEKLETMALEFGAVLTTQLESQRLFYEKQLDVMQREQALALAALERRLVEAVEQARDDREAVRTLSDRLTAADRERAKLEARLTQLTAKHRELTRQHDDDSALNAALDRNLAALKEQDAQKARTIADLEDQLRDIMFYMDSQRRVAESPHRDEIADGQIIIPPGESPAPAQTTAGSTPPSSRGSRRRRA